MGLLTSINKVSSSHPGISTLETVHVGKSYDQIMKIRKASMRKVPVLVHEKFPCAFQFTTVKYARLIM